MTSENGAETCIIDCQNEENHRGFYFHSNETEASVLKGFTIRDGKVSILGDSVGGGGILCESSSPSIESCIITGNQAVGVSGGGIYLKSGNLTLTNCVITLNDSIFGNYCEGGGVFCEYSPGFTLTINNSTIVFNRVISAWGLEGHEVNSQMDVKIRNSIIWGHRDSEYSWPSLSDVAYSDIKGGFPGVGNINVEPLLARYTWDFDRHLLPDSPCIDAGTSEGAPSTDLDGNVRPVGTSVDMGAYEFSWPTKLTTYIYMPSHNFYDGDICSCAAKVWNPTENFCNGYSLFVIIDAHGEFFFAPSFNKFDYFKWNFSPGITRITILPEFTWSWPSLEFTSSTWYAFLMNPDMTELVGGIGIFDFMWDW